MNTSLATSIELEARAAWSVITEPADAIAGRFVAALGHSTALRTLEDSRESIDALVDTHAAPDRETAAAAVQRWLPRMQSRSIEFALQEAARHDIRLIDPSTVPGLSDLDIRIPHLLWVRGDDEALVGTPLSSKVAIIGARAESSYGEAVTWELSTALAQRDITIVSGAAYGVDATAHRAALSSNGRTVAWLANGVDRPYPAGNRDLLERIAANPGSTVVSEIPPGSAPTRHRFIARQRLIAASTAATICTEAGWRSGSILTATEAMTLGRGVGSVPGRIDSPASAGTNRLLREGVALTITSADDAAELLQSSS